ncbi:MAG TPA: site-specific integrase [Blastocatellia bacterium]|nr:site-specific integrase [Blastocatellia bacterium]
MTGQIIKHVAKDKTVTYRIRVFLGRDASGTRHYHRETVKGTKAQAEERLTEILNKVNRGSYVKPCKYTVDEFLDRWLEHVKPTLRQNTYISYESYLKWYVRPDLKLLKLSKIKLIDIDNLYVKLQARVSARTIRYVHSILSSAMKQAIIWQLIESNPCDNATLPRKIKKEMQALSADQMIAFLQHAQKDCYALIFDIALATGMRPSEYLALQWKDIDFQDGSIQVRRTVSWDNIKDPQQTAPAWQFEETKSDNGRRSIPLPKTLLRKLQLHKTQQAAYRLKKGQKYANHDLLFATRSGNPISEYNIRRNFKLILDKAGLPKTIRLYDLRHTCATILLAKGVNPKIVSERLGHSSIVLTLDTYSHVLPTMQKAAAEELEKVLFGN